MNERLSELQRGRGGRLQVALRARKGPARRAATGTLPAGPREGVYLAWPEKFLKGQ